MPADCSRFPRSSPLEDGSRVGQVNCRQVSAVFLVLEIISPEPMLSGVGRHVFGREGGTIGRGPRNSWVLPHANVSGVHARITFNESVFYIEDTSRNGVFVNSSQHRLVRDQPYPLKAGDRILIDPYEIRVSIEAEERVQPARPGDSASSPPSQDPFSDRFDPLESVRAWLDPPGGRTRPTRTAGPRAGFPAVAESAAG